MIRWAFDVGANSIGWAIYEVQRQSNAPLSPSGLIASGVRIFSDGRNPQDGESLAVMRRIPRGARRRRDRFIQRRDWLMQLLVRHGLMPEADADRKALEALDPYPLRARGLDQRLELFELGRAIFHLNQRRGFKSNRILDGNEEDKERGKIAAGVQRLKERLAAENCRTLGEFHARRQTGPVREREAVRARLNGIGAKALYEFYPARELLEAELDALWTAQANFHPTALSDSARTSIRDAVLFQRPLKRPEIGRCTFVPDERRLPAAHPQAQAIRIFQELNNLRLETGLRESRALTLTERDLLAAHLMNGDDLTFGQLRKALKLPSDIRINLADRKRERLNGNATAHRLADRKKGALRRIWSNLGDHQRSAIVEQALRESDPDEFASWLSKYVGATQEEAEAAAKVRMPDGYTRLGATATAKILAALKSEVITYAEAAKRAGYHHSDERDGVILDPLPYYGEVLQRHVAFGTGDLSDPIEKRFGRIANPTVHIGLNQMRKLVNALRDAYGEPDQIVLELARDLKRSREEKERADKENAANQRKNEERERLLASVGFPINGLNKTLLRLWEELAESPLERRCVYTGEEISINRLMSGDVEVEHILPFSRTLDDSMANKTVAMRGANREKRNQSPYEAWGGQADRYETILVRAQSMPPNKRWRFKPDAMEKYESKERDFLARQLNETRHLSVLAKRYLSKVCDPDQVWVTTGQLTALLRRHWGLNSILRGHNRGEADTDDKKGGRKVRDDHRHHAVDAIVIGAIDRNLLQEISKRAGQHEKDDLDRIVSDIPVPFEGFRDAVRASVERIVVSHKPEHGTGGRLHEDTAYGIVEGPEKAIGDLVTRKPIDALTPKEIDGVRDVRLRETLQALRDSVGGDMKALAQALAKYGAENRIRRVRVLKPEKDFVTIKDRRTGAPYKAVIPGENHHIDIVEGGDGKWLGFAASVFDANQKGAATAWNEKLPDAKLIMRVHKGDMIELTDQDGVRRIKRVVQLKIASRRLLLAEHAEAGALQERHDDKGDVFRWDMATISKLKQRGARLVYVDEINRVCR